jgi:glycine/serine hydroxymethyltransferase
MKEEEMTQIGDTIGSVLLDPTNKSLQKATKALVKKLTDSFPVYSVLN